MGWQVCGERMMMQWCLVWGVRRLSATLDQQEVDWPMSKSVTRRMADEKRGVRSCFLGFVDG